MRNRLLALRGLCREEEGDSTFGVLPTESNERPVLRSRLGLGGSATPEPTSNPPQTQESGDTGDEKWLPRHRHRALHLRIRLVPTLAVHLGHNSLTFDPMAVTAIVRRRRFVRHQRYPVLPRAVSP